MRRYYAIQRPADDTGSFRRLCFDECHEVVAFASKSGRDRWIRSDDRPVMYVREAADYATAANIASKIMHSAVGGRQSGRDCLRQLYPNR